MGVPHCRWWTRCSSSERATMMMMMAMPRARQRHHELGASSSSPPRPAHTSSSQRSRHATPHSRAPHQPAFDRDMSLFRHLRNVLKHHKPTAADDDLPEEVRRDMELHPDPPTSTSTTTTSTAELDPKALYNAQFKSAAAAAATGPAPAKGASSTWQRAPTTSTSSTPSASPATSHTRGTDIEISSPFNVRHTDPVTAPAARVHLAPAPRAEANPGTVNECPICRMALGHLSNTELNAHIDQCLSKPFAALGRPSDDDDELAQFVHIPSSTQERRGGSGSGSGGRAAASQSAYALYQEQLRYLGCGRVLVRCEY